MLRRVRGAAAGELVVFWEFFFFVFVVFGVGFFPSLIIFFSRSKNFQLLKKN